MESIRGSLSGTPPSPTLPRGCQMVSPLQVIRASMMAKPLAALILAGAMSNGCTEATSPNHFNTGIRVEVLAPLRTAGIQDTEVAVRPSVRVLDAVTDAPVAGKVFTFTLESPIGAKETVSVMTGS